MRVKRMKRMTGATSAETHGPIPDRGGTATASPFCFADTSDNASHEEPSVHAISANTARPQKVRGAPCPSGEKCRDNACAHPPCGTAGHGGGPRRGNRYSYVAPAPRAVASEIRAYYIYIYYDVLSLDDLTAPASAGSEEVKKLAPHHFAGGMFCDVRGATRGAGAVAPEIGMPRSPRLHA